MKRILLFSLTVLVLLLSSCELSFERHHPAPEVGTVRVVVYGNDYVFNPSVYLGSTYVGKANKLQGTVNDAVQIGYALTSLARKADRNVECTYLLGSSDMTSQKDEILAFDSSAAVYLDASLQTMKETLSDISMTASPNDMTFVFYAGHGYGQTTTVPYSEDVSAASFLVFTDVDPHQSVLWSANDFLDAVNAIPGTKVILGDFCYSGALVKQGNVSAGEDEFSDITIRSLFREYRGKVCENPSTFCLTAARYNEKSYESSKDIYHHGYFTNAILRAIGWNEKEKCIGEIKVLDAKGRLTLLNLANYVILNDGKAAQTPMVSGGSNDIVLFAF
ncbi:MAG: caspase family protein [Sphaerochaetaceae bacterium]|nr:caspase family protein [Sphaerochaetaceae bacterium]